MTETIFNKVFDWAKEQGVLVVFLIGLSYLFWERNEETNQIFIDELKEVKQENKKLHDELLKCYELGIKK